MKNLICMFMILICCLGLESQNSINDYKYVIVPAEYDFLGANDKYQLNSLTKFLFNKYGFKAFLNEDELPEDLKKDGCLAMYADLENMRGFLKTKVQMHLKDCYGKVIHSSKIGETKEKELQKSFQLALRDAFSTYRDINYSYLPKNNGSNNNESTIPISDAVAEKVEKDHKETDRLLKAINKDKKETTDSDEEKEVPSVVVSGIPDHRDAEIITEDDVSTKNNAYSLYAQPIKNGFQIVDTEPKKVMVLYNSGIDNVYIVKGKDAIVYKKDGSWLYSESGVNVETKVLDIKF